MDRVPRVLVVDDDEPVRKMVAMAFEFEGFEVAQAGDGADAIVQTELFSPDVVVMDIMMPRMDGLAALGHLRRQGATAELPVILLSAKSDSADIAIGMRVGADDYVTKPFETEDLVTRARRVIAAPAHRPVAQPAPPPSAPVQSTPPLVTTIDPAAPPIDAPVRPPDGRHTSVRLILVLFVLGIVALVVAALVR